MGCGGQYKSLWLNKYPSKSISFQIKIAFFSSLYSKWMWLCPSSEWEDEVNERPLKHDEGLFSLCLCHITQCTFWPISSHSPPDMQIHFPVLVHIALSFSIPLALSFPHTHYRGTSESGNPPPSLLSCEFPAATDRLMYSPELRGRPQPQERTRPLYR